MTIIGASYWNRVTSSYLAVVGAGLGSKTKIERKTSVLKQ